MTSLPPSPSSAVPQVGGSVLLSVRDLATHFETSGGTARAVDGISFEIRRGETFALVGESGCGKSVTALSLMRLVPAPAGRVVSGQILLEGTDLAKLPEARMRAIRGDRISMIFQEPMTSLNPVFTIGFQITEVLRLHQGMGPAAARARAIEMLKLVRIADPERRIDEYPHQMSGGMRQRVMIAMALACEPDLLIADEPTTALDVTIQAQILDLIKDLQKETGTAVLLITHDLAVVAEVASRVAVMYAGKIVEQGTVADVLREPRHPYTVKLLESLPGARKRGEKLRTIRGMVPPATEYPVGCRFADRCPRVMVGCAERLPTLAAIAPGHDAACHLFDPAFPQTPLAPPPQGVPDPSGARSDPGHKSSEPAPLGLEEKTAATPPCADKRQSPPGTFFLKPLLEIESLTVHFPIRQGILKKIAGHVRAVDGVDLAIARGETLALVGESGCGKTTLGKALLGLAPITAGAARYNSVDLAALSHRERFPYRRRMQMVFQDPYSSLNPRMLVGEILEEGMKIHRLGGSRPERAGRAARLLARVGLDAKATERYPHEFSGGQRQRIGIARALSVEPEFLILDEATSALDVSIQAQIINILVDLRGELGLTYLLITHDLSVVEYLADRVAVMYLGRIVELGTVDEIFMDPKHPYTRALLSAVPRMEAQDTLPKIRLPGNVPSPVHPPAGCHFHPRCPEAKPECAVRAPKVTALSGTRTTRCLLYE